VYNCKICLVVVVLCDQREVDIPTRTFRYAECARFRCAVAVNISRDYVRVNSLRRRVVSRKELTVKGTVVVVLL
jgi:hypothetical protein